MGIKIKLKSHPALLVLFKEGQLRLCIVVVIKQVRRTHLFIQKGRMNEEIYHGLRGRRERERREREKERARERERERVRERERERER